MVTKSAAEFIHGHRRVTLLAKRLAFFALPALVALPALADQAGSEVPDRLPPGQYPTDLADRPYSPYADRAYPTNVYFGETHSHSVVSGDAGGAGTRLTPRDAYRFARGEQVTSNSGQAAKLARPFDFYALTDHTDGMGAIQDVISGAPNVLADPQGKELHEAFAQGGETAQQAAFRMISLFAQGKISPALNYQPDNPAFAKVWSDQIAAAEEFNEPHRFTTLIAYEWTALVNGNNLHRNVILRDDGDIAGQMLPYTTTPPFGSPNPRDLWAWMQSYEDKTGGRVLAIPHNGNVSNGMMFAMQDDFDGGAAFDEAYATARARWEPLYEAMQIKGDGEAHPFLSPDDEFADFETWDWGNLDLSEAKTPDMLAGEYLREGLKRGLRLRAELGVNPFQFGLVGGTDNHLAMSTVDEDNFFGKFAQYEPGPNRAMHTAKQNQANGLAYASWRYAAQGATAVWARENTREAIWDALERRETYATTGPRMRIRFFGGYGFVPEDLNRRDLALIGYDKGVPMGDELASAPEGIAPSFMVFALRDPMGANFDRVQIVKGWRDREGDLHEKIYDVAWSGARTPGEDGKIGPVGNSVDLSVPSWSNAIGAPELGAVWQDPDFSPGEQAFYYARVLEIPTPRWTAYDAVAFDLELPDEVPLISQQRAYTSPIWYVPR